jgi:hypothetical protein
MSITDLKFQQLADKLPDGAIAYDALANSIAIYPAVITGDSIDSMESEGVMELLFKLLDEARLAQNEVNKTESVGNRLAALPQPVYGAPIQATDGNSYTQVTSL